MVSLTTATGLKWGWKIVRDYISPKGDECYQVGKERGVYHGGKFRYRLKDDDGNTYYILLSDIDPNEGTERQLFAPLDWAMSYAGCTSIEYKDEKTGKYEYL
jgi:hypothetical protein